jgi:O-acetyl-ADP-ribose deacetylase (regulator of RNase III)
MGMIREAHGDILAADVEALVNPVNTVGVMGAGLALQFKRKYPAMFREYAAVCQRGGLRPGNLTVHQVKGHPRYVINFATKRHWKPPSRLEWIEGGLVHLRQKVTVLGIRSIAVPPLGCGLGGLEWSQVRELIVTRLDLPDVDVVLYPPRDYRKRSL